MSIVRLAILLCLRYRPATADGVGTFKTTHVGPKPLWNETHVDRLKKDLLQNYDRFLRPEHSNDPTQLKIALTILHLEIDEAKSTIMLDSWLTLEWTDSKLRWNEKDYGGLTQIKVADHEVWQPDIFLYNSVGEGEQLPRVGSKNVVVYSKGKVLWVPSIKLTALCDFNMRHWPFDQQRCYLKLGSWTFSSQEIKMENSSMCTVEDTASASSWEIEVSGEVTSTKYACCVETYESLTYRLNITRKSTPYVAIIVPPAVVSTLLLLAQFWLPPDGEEKIILNGISALMINMFLLYFNHQSYTTSGEAPLIVVFYSCSLYIVGFATVSSVVAYSLCRMKNPRPLSGCLRSSMRSVGKWLLVNDVAHEKRGQPDDEDSDKRRMLANLIRDEWTFLAVCIDRLLFVCTTFAFIVLAICLA
ncbi:hypothetical protein PPYR_03122 [Photinus pyralis]|uniref:Neurotransmitter-gated ion-channel ligand-binding domain-containing protein n=2 Tax=Photinus pyralis TaxID=7054 RepID=A0A5N4A1X4_PHOPY|nr:acetylcholine receptor subunit alpha-type acr-16-like [Photinus pyralis]KAB0791322.1 hypothetical protein PPYR_03122 [Photinus pyralis]